MVYQTSYCHVSVADLSLIIKTPQISIQYVFHQDFPKMRLLKYVHLKNSIEIVVSLCHVILSPYYCLHMVMVYSGTPYSLGHRLRCYTPAMVCFKSPVLSQNHIPS